MKYLLYLFNTPSAFYDNPLAYARNVVGHVVLIGLLMSYLTFFGGAVAYAAWEYLQYRLRNATLSDCVEDWAFVMSGSYAFLTLSPELALIASGFLLSGYLYRKELKNG